MLPPMRLLLLGVLGVVFTVGCVHAPSAPPPSTTPALEPADVARLLPPTVKDRAGWADDIVVAILMTGKVPTAERACAVIAVIGQESGFKADPPVANLPKIVREGLDEKLAPLGPLAGPARDAILEGHAPGDTRTFGERIAALKTERDLDRFFRDVAAAYRGEMPGSFAVAQALSFLLGKGSLEDLNPVTTAGSMQVKVSFARAIGEKDGLGDDDVRELLYTRGGGVRFGTARLIGYPAGYDDVISRFADYNAGVYAARNAALQSQLADLTGLPLVPDGDLLAWDDDGEPKDVETKSLQALLRFGEAHGLSARTVRRDAQKEKSIDLEQTDTWKAVKQAWAEKHGRAAPYARLPEVALSSPKLSRPRTTAWFAESVKRRFVECRARDKAPTSTPSS
jgi:hypothetical protein